MSNIVQYNNGHIFSQLGAELVFTQNAQGEYLSFYWQSRLAQNQLPQEQKILKPLLKDTYLELIQRVINRKIPEQCQYILCYEQHCIPFELVISPILLPDGSVESVLVMGRSLEDASHISPEATSALPTNPDPYQKLLTNIARKIRRTLDLETIGQQTVDSIGKALKVSRCLLMIPTHHEELLEVKAEYCQPPYPSVLGLQIDYQGYQEIKEAISSRRGVSFTPLSYPTCDAISVLLIPTFYQQELNGIICLHQCDRPRNWNEAEWEFVQELADQVGTAMAHATLYQKLEIANEEAKEASRLKSEFLASTSHELRTPLNGILGFLKLVLDDMADDKEEEREFIQQAYNSALHLLNLINDILDIAKIEAGKMEFELTVVSFNQICKEIYQFAHAQAQKKNLYFQINLPSTYDDILIYADYQRLLQVMLNLVSNSLKFTHEGGIKIRGEIIPKQVTINDETLPGMLKVSVEDTGIGVSLDKQERLFETFYQVDGSRTKAYGGTGLGLAISKRLVEAMGGKISFYSMGEFLGTTVTFTVPLSQLPIMNYPR